MARPVGKIIVKHAATGQRYTLATIWPGEGDFPANVSFERTTDKEGQYPTISLTDFAKAEQTEFEKTGKRAFFADFKDFSQPRADSSGSDSPF